MNQPGMSQLGPSIGELFRQAIHAHQAGRLPDAEALYRRVLDLDPAQADALHLLGVIAHQSERYDVAVETIGRAIRLQPHVAHYHSNLGNALKGLRRLAEAEASYREALRLKPDFADVYNNLGGVLRRLGRLEEAKNCYEQALRLTPEFPEVYNNLGNILKDLGQASAAEASYRAALRLRPVYAEAYNNLGILHMQQGAFDAAAEAFGQVIALRPDYAPAHDALGLAQMERGHVTAAFAAFRTALHLDPHNPQVWANWAACVAQHNFSFTAVDDRLFDDLLRLLDQPETLAKNVMRTVLEALRQHPELRRVLALTAAADARHTLVYDEAARRLAAVPLLLRALTLACVNVPDFETMLTALRRAGLTAVGRGTPDDSGLAFSAALALQCFVNEYAFAETNDETAAVDTLAREIAATLARGDVVPPARLAALAAYRPLCRFPWADALLVRQSRHGPGPAALADLLTRQVAEPRAEQALRGSIRRLTPVADTVSQAVRDQYEENPYPRWMKATLHHRPETLDQILRTLFPHLDLSAWTLPQRLDILVAGCGTGRQALDAATMYADARVVAVDLSLASLAYALRQTQALGVANIEYAQADILELATLDRHFDVIECAGVLHHLREPLAGWRALVDRLRPGGLMRIGLYSELARRGVVGARALIAAKGYSAAPEDIRRCRQDILALAADPAAAAAAPEIAALAQSDIYSLSECRDLLFHVQEHRFTLPQIETALGTLDLEFLGFENRTAVQRFRAGHADPAALTSLAHWHRFETESPDSFIGMYQFWCRKR